MERYAKTLEWNLVNNRNFLSGHDALQYYTVIGDFEKGSRTLAHMTAHFSDLFRHSDHPQLVLSAYNYYGPKISQGIDRTIQDPGVVKLLSRIRSKLVKNQTFRNPGEKRWPEVDIAYVKGAEFGHFKDLITGAFEKHLISMGVREGDVKYVRASIGGTNSFILALVYSKFPELLSHRKGMK